MYRQTDIQIDRLTDEHKYKQTYRQRDRQTDRQKKATKI